MTGLEELARRVDRGEYAADRWPVPELVVGLNPMRSEPYGIEAAMAHTQAILRREAGPEPARPEVTAPLYRCVVCRRALVEDASWGKWRRCECGWVTTYQGGLPSPRSNRTAQPGEPIPGEAED